MSILLAALLLARLSAALDVATPVDFNTSIYAGITHIRIVEHLDLSDFDVSLAANNNQKHYFNLCTTTASVRGNCSTAFSGKSDLDVPMLPLQCHLLLPWGINFVVLPTVSVWFDNLYLQDTVKPANATQLYQTKQRSPSLMVQLYFGSQAWLTYVTMQGDFNLSTALEVHSTSAATYNSASAYLYKVSISRFSSPAVFVGPVYNGGYLSIQNSTLTRNNVLSPTTGVIETREPQGIQDYAVTSLMGVSFPSNAANSMLLKAFTRTLVASDNPSHRVMQMDALGSVSSATLDVVPAAQRQFMVDGRHPKFQAAVLATGGFKDQDVVSAPLPPSPTAPPPLSMPPPPAVSTPMPPPAPRSDVPVAVPLPQPTNDPCVLDPSSCDVSKEGDGGARNGVLIAAVIGTVLGAVALAAVLVGILFWMRRQPNPPQQTFSGFGWSEQTSAAGGPSSMGGPGYGMGYPGGGYRGVPFTPHGGPHSMARTPSIGSNPSSMHGSMHGSAYYGQQLSLRSNHANMPRDVMSMTAVLHTAVVGPGGVTKPTSDIQTNTETMHATHDTEFREGVDGIEDALDELYRSGTPFLGKYVIAPHNSVNRRVGGQGVVQFASTIQPVQEFAIKFFLQKDAFDAEAELYKRPELRRMMPATREIVENADGSVVSKAGYRFPPCIVIEKGQSLDEYAATELKRDEDGYVQALHQLAMLQCIMFVADRLAQLHAAGFVHRDIKPGNILRLPAKNEWTLIDFGCTVPAGESATLTFTPSYAPPEVMRAFQNGAKSMEAQTSVDIWALGVISYEVLTNKPAVSRTDKNDAFNRILGNAPLPWEVQGRHGLGRDLGRLRDTILQMLQRDPARRPTAREVLNAWSHMFQVATMTQSGATA